jgi:putative addiction module antidote
MERTLKIRRVGGSLGAIFPKEMLEELGVGEGSELAAVGTSDGILLRALDPTFADAMDAFEEVRREYHNTLKKLAE